MTRKVLVLSASEFLGSHVTRALAARGHDVGVFVRSSSNTSTIDSLPIAKQVGDLRDAGALASAMQGCSWVFHCIVDTRAWLYDPAPLYRTNVEGLLHVMDAALEAGTGGGRLVSRQQVSARRSGVGGRRRPGHSGVAGAVTSKAFDASVLPFASVTANDQLPTWSPIFFRLQVR